MNIFRLNDAFHQKFLTTQDKLKQQRKAIMTVLKIVEKMEAKNSMLEERLNKLESQIKEMKDLPKPVNEENPTTESELEINRMEAKLDKIETLLKETNEKVDIFMVEANAKIKRVEDKMTDSKKHVKTLKKEFKSYINGVIAIIHEKMVFKDSMPGLQDKIKECQKLIDEAEEMCKNLNKKVDKTIHFKLPNEENTDSSSSSTD